MSTNIFMTICQPCICILLHGIHSIFSVCIRFSPLVVDSLTTVGIERMVAAEVAKVADR